MGLMGQIGNLLQQYAGGGAGQSAQTNEHFDQVAGAVDRSTMANGLAGAIRSDQTPAFGQLAGQLFGSSDPNQKANMLNELIAAAGPMLPQLIGSGIGGGMLSQILASGGRVTPQVAQQVPPDVVTQVAQHAERQDPSIIDRVSNIYAEHPGIVRTLGTGVLAVALAKIAERVNFGN